MGSHPTPGQAVTPAELEAIKARCDAAAPGPWKAWVEGRDHWGGDTIISRFEGEEDLYVHGATNADLDFIAHARSDVPALLEAIDVLRDMLVDAQTEAEMHAAEVERLRKVIEQQRQVVGRNPTPEEYNRAAARANCDRSPCSCGMHRDRT